MPITSTSGATPSLAFKTIVFKTFSGSQRREMQEVTNSLLREGYELIQCQPFTEYAPFQPGEQIQRAGASILLVFGKRE